MLLLAAKNDPCVEHLSTRVIRVTVRTDTSWMPSVSPYSLQKSDVESLARTEFTVKDSAL